MGDMSEDTNEVRRISVSEAPALLDTGRGVLVDVRDRRLYDQTHAAGAVSLPLAVIQATQGRVPAGARPPHRVLTLYSAGQGEGSNAPAPRTLFAEGYEGGRGSAGVGGMR